MKASIRVLLSICLGRRVLGNIPVSYKVTLSCDHASPYFTGCLRGMQCVEDGRYAMISCPRHLLYMVLTSGSCVKPAVQTYPQSFEVDALYNHLPRSLDDLIPRAYSSDGKCGPDNGGLTCDPNSAVYNGTCCSQYGWCGDTIDYCGSGCISGCSSAASTISSSASSPNPTATASATQEPVLGKPSTAPSTGPITADGTCGAGNGNTVCGNWPKGACCSLYGVRNKFGSKELQLTGISFVVMTLRTAAVAVKVDHVWVPQKPQRQVPRLLQSLQTLDPSRSLVSPAYRQCTPV